MKVSATISIQVYAGDFRVKTPYYNRQMTFNGELDDLKSMNVGPAAGNAFFQGLEEFQKMVAEDQEKQEEGINDILEGDETPEA